MTTARVGQIADQIRGVTYSKGEASDTPSAEHVKLLRAGNIGELGLLLDDLTYVPSSRVSERQILQTNDVLIAASSGSLSVVGKAARVLEKPDATFGAFCKVLRPTSLVDPAYFAHYFRTHEYRRYISSVAAGANINNLRGEDLDRIEIPLPPLPEQRRIATILDDADALRAKRSKSVALLAELPSVQFNNRRTTRWRQSTVGDVADLQGGLTVNARRTSLPTVAAYLRVANVFRGSMDLSNLKEIGVSDAELSRTRLKRGDVLVVEGHGNLAEVGRAAMVDHLPEEPLTHQNHLFRLRARGGAVTGRFLELAINSRSARETLKRFANTTSGLNTLNATSIRNLPILVAPLDEQHEIEAEFAVAAATRSVAQRQKKDVDSLFASLQHRAFRGEL